MVATEQVTANVLHCTYIVTLRCVRAANVIVEKQLVLQILECLYVPLGTQHAMRTRHIDICGLPRSTIFFRINGGIFGKKLLKIKFVFWFSLQLLSAKFPILRRTARDMLKNVYRCSSKVPVILVTF